MSEALILGSGPAGLAVSACLQARGVRTTVLEAGDRPSHGWKLLNPEGRLLTPQVLSRLPGMKLSAGLPSYVSLGDYATELDRYREQHRIEVQCGVRALRVAQRYGRFELEVGLGSRTEIRSAKWVVDASGGTTQPVVPEDAPETPPWRAVHSRDARGEDYSQARSLLVVGCGTSAREAVESYLRLRPRGGELTLAARSAPRAVAHFLLGLDTHYLAWPLEFWPGHWPGPHHGWTRDPALGLSLARGLRRGTIRNVGAIRSYGATVAGEHGSVQPDLVVYATGYRHAAPHLGALVQRNLRGEPVLKRAAVVGVPGLYALGVRYGRSLASSFLRGIARDAQAVATRIANEAST